MSAPHVPSSAAATATPAVPVRPVATPPEAGHLKSDFDDKGRKVTHEKGEFRGKLYDVENAVNDFSTAGCVLRTLATPFIGAWWLATKAAGSKTASDNAYNQFVWSDGYVSKKYSEKSIGRSKAQVIQKFGFDVTSKKDLSEQIELAREEGRLLRNGAHQYVILKGGSSAAIIVPNGDVSKASVRDFWNRSTGEGYENPDKLERVIQCFLMGYDTIEKEGAESYELLVFDLDTKKIRGFLHAPSPNTSLDNMAIGHNFKVDGGLMDGMRNKFDPEKVESKTNLHGDKVEGTGKKKKRGDTAAAAARDEDDGLPPDTFPVKPPSSGPGGGSGAKVEPGKAIEIPGFQGNDHFQAYLDTDGRTVCDKMGGVKIGEMREGRFVPLAPEGTGALPRPMIFMMGSNGRTAGFSPAHGPAVRTTPPATRDSSTAEPVDSATPADKTARVTVETVDDEEPAAAGGSVHVDV